MMMNAFISLVLEMLFVQLMHLDNIVANVQKGGVARIAVLTSMSATGIQGHLVTMVAPASTLLGLLHAVVFLVTQVNCYNTVNGMN